MEVWRVSRDACKAHMSIKKALQSEQDTNAWPSIHDPAESRAFHRRFSTKFGQECLAQDRLLYVSGEPDGGPKRIENNQSDAACRDRAVHQDGNL